MTMQPGASVQILAQQAQQAVAAGRVDDAVRLWQQVLAQDQNNGPALFFLGQHALHAKNFAAAQALLERAAIASPNEPGIPLNLAFLFRGTGDTAAEMESLMRTLTIDPYFYPALLSKGSLLERMGKAKEAAQVFKNALTVAPPDEQVPPPLRPTLAHARKVVEQNQISLERHLNTRLKDVQTAGSADRLNEIRDVAIGKKKVYTQEPSLLHIPRLPAIQFYDDAEFPWLKDLEAAAPAIREEFLAVFNEDNAAFAPYVNHPDGVPIAQWAELNRSLRWSVFFLWKDGVRIEENCARVPKTAAAVDAVPKIVIPNFGPTVMFSLLAPHTTIPAHSSVTNARLVTHLPLIVPPGCRFRVGNETRDWKEGKAWVFDDTINHEAWNDSDQLRVILMIDIWNPRLDTTEREYVSELLNGVREFYRDA